MKWFKKEEVIPCYREKKQDRCVDCRLTQAVTRLPNGLDQSMDALIDVIMDPAREKLSMPIICNSGFRCPRHNSYVKGASQSQHMRCEAMDCHCADNRKLAQIIVAQGKFDQLIIYPTFIHVSYKKAGGNRKQILKKTATGYQRIDASSI
jgi:hypothetical protein